jgi:hypothetical protein
MQLNSQLRKELKQIIFLAKSSIEYYDALKPIALDKFKIDLFDLVFLETDSIDSDNTSEISFTSTDNNELSDHPICRNDISMHNGFHYCSRKCSGATFICGCTYLNSSGSWTKCGFISYSDEHRHPCSGCPDHYFENSRSDSHTDFTSKRSKPSFFNDVISSEDSYSDRYHREWDNYDYDF